MTHKLIFTPFFYLLFIFSNIANGSVSSNPAAVDIETGTGALGEHLGFSKNSGVRLGGLLIEELNYLFSGGVKPNSWSGNSLFILNLTLNTEQLRWWKNGKFGTEFLRFDGSPTNQFAGSVQGYNSLPGLNPLNRSELYQLWYRHEFFDKKLIIRIGKQLPNYDFTNVIRPVQLADSELFVPATTSLIYTPIYVNSSMLGVLPGYYNSVYGIAFSFQPSDTLYFNYGIYDGNLARNKQTGLRGPQFNSYRFQMFEFGHIWGLHGMPGNIGIGVWNQSGKLTAKKIKEHGAEGIYMFGTQRLWWQHPGEDISGIIGFVQAGINDSKTLFMNIYSGAGLTFLGLVPHRKEDAFGFGFAFAKLNKRLFVRKNELILQGYYQAVLFKSSYFLTAFSYIPNPGASNHLKPAYAVTARIIALF